MSYLKNNILNGELIEKSDDTGTIIANFQNYTTYKLDKLYDFIETCDVNWFTYINVDYNDTLPRLSLEYYNNKDYWDIILLVNKKDTFSCLPFDDDTIKKMAINKVTRYIQNIYGTRLSNFSYNLLYEKFLNELEMDNSTRFIIRIVKPSNIQEFLQYGYEKGIF